MTISPVNLEPLFGENGCAVTALRITLAPEVQRDFYLLQSNILVALCVTDDCVGVEAACMDQGNLENRLIELGIIDDGGEPVRLNSSSIENDANLLTIIIAVTDDQYCEIEDGLTVLVISADEIGEITAILGSPNSLHAAPSGSKM